MFSQIVQGILKLGGSVSTFRRATARAAIKGTAKVRKADIAARQTAPIKAGELTKAKQAASPQTSAASVPKAKGGVMESVGEGNFNARAYTKIFEGAQTAVSQAARSTPQGATAEVSGMRPPTQAGVERAEKSTQHVIWSKETAAKRTQAARDAAPSSPTDPARSQQQTTRAPSRTQGRKPNTPENLRGPNDLRQAFRDFKTEMTAGYRRRLPQQPEAQGSILSQYRDLHRAGKMLPRDKVWKQMGSQNRSPTPQEMVGASRTDVQKKESQEEKARQNRMGRSAVVSGAIGTGFAAMSANPLGAAVAVVTAYMAAAKAVSAFAKGALEGQRHLKMYNAHMANAYAMLEHEQRRRDRLTAQETGGSAARLANAYNELQNELRPITSLLTVIKNETLIQLLQMVKLGMNDVTRIMKIAQFLVELNPLLKEALERYLRGGTDNQHATKQFLDTLASGRFGPMTDQYE